MGIVTRKGAVYQARRTMHSILIYVCAIALLLFLVTPYLWMFISSISFERELITVPPSWFPKEPTFHRYLTLIAGRGGQKFGGVGRDFGKAFLNTTIVSALSGIVVVILASSSAYILSFSFRQSKKLMFSLLISQMIPGITILIPLYLMLGNMGLRNTRLGLIIVYAGLMLPVSILILRNHFMTIPMEIIESAVLDGCTHFQVLSRIILPVVAPGLFATVFYVFLNVWNEFFFALILSESADVKMISVAISEFSTQGGIDYGMMSTAGVIGSVIPLILVILFQKHITEGLVSGWSK